MYSGKKVTIRVNAIHLYLPTEELGLDRIRSHCQPLLSVNKLNSSVASVPLNHQLMASWKSCINYLYIMICKLWPKKKNDVQIFSAHGKAKSIIKSHTECNFYLCALAQR